MFFTISLNIVLSFGSAVLATAITESRDVFFIEDNGKHLF
jgi:hypothetical protein